jgi:hypothetical protein
MQNKELVEIYSTSRESFAVGSIVYQNDDHLFLKALDDQGRDDGYILFKKNIIQEVEEDTDYLRKIEKYQDFWQDLKIKKSESSFFYKNPDLKDLIEYAYKNKKIVNIAISFNYFDFVTGYIKDFDTDYLVIEALDFNSGQVFDEFEIDIDQIILFEIDSIDSMLLDFINKKR